jgi:hypothetical protein
MAYVVVLTERAQQVTRTEKDCPGTVPSYQRGLFTEVGIITGDFHLSAGAAKPFFPFQPVYAALAGTHPTRAQFLQGLLRTLLQKTLAVKLQI